MSIMSAEELYSDGQAITATVASTNVIDHGDPGKWVHSSIKIVDDKGMSGIALGLVVTEAFDNLTNIAFAFQTDNNAAFGSGTTIFSETIVLASLVVGAKMAVRFIPHTTLEQYTRFNYTVTGTTPTVGKVTAGIMKLESTWGNR